MPKINKYIEQIDTANEAFYNTILALGEETKKQMDEAILLYSEAGSVVRVNQIYQAAIEKANEMKDAHVAKLTATLQAERSKVKEGIEQYKNKSTEEKILAQLERISGFNSLTAEISSMTDEEILNIANEKYLSKDEAAIIRKELSSRAKERNDNSLAVQSRTIKSVTTENLLDEAQSVINTYSNGQVFPGIPISLQMQGGINKILHEDMVAKKNEDFYFKDGYID